MNRVVITGLGVVSALGRNVAEFRDGLLSGRCAIGPITQFDTSEHQVKVGAEVPNYVPEDHFDKNQLAQIDHASSASLVGVGPRPRSSGSSVRATTASARVRGV